jgi:hypothetical protein
MRFVFIGTVAEAEREEVAALITEAERFLLHDPVSQQSVEGPIMQNVRDIEKEILATGKVDSEHLTALRRRLYANGKIDRAAVDFLAELHKRVQHPNPAFEELFYGAVKDHILADRRIDAEETAWLRQMLFADGKFHDEGRKFLHQLKGEAQQVSPEFESLFRESMKEPFEQRTCGG